MLLRFIPCVMDRVKPGNDGERVGRALRALLHLRLLRAGAADGLDRHRGEAGFRRDLAVLLLDDGARGLVLVEAAERARRYLAVGALGAVLIDDVEQDEIAACAATGFAGHGRYPLLQRKTRRVSAPGFGIEQSSEQLQIGGGR